MPGDDDMGYMSNQDADQFYFDVDGATAYDDSAIFANKACFSDVVAARAKLKQGKATGSDTLNAEA
eukprot:11004885-Karenia_brevis.AAC.1